MLIQIPKRLQDMGAELAFPANNPLGVILPVKDGAVINSRFGKTIGQVFRQKKGGVRLSFGDGVSLDITQNKKTKEVDIRPSFAESRPTSSYILFGDAAKFQYELYRKEPNTIKPFSVCTVVSDLRNNALYDMSVKDDENILKTVLICLAVSLL